RDPDRRHRDTRVRSSRRRRGTIVVRLRVRRDAGRGSRLGIVTSMVPMKEAVRQEPNVPAAPLFARMLHPASLLPWLPLWGGGEGVLLGMRMVQSSANASRDCAGARGEEEYQPEHD